MRVATAEYRYPVAIAGQMSCDRFAQDLPKSGRIRSAAPRLTKPVLRRDQKAEDDDDTKPNEGIAIPAILKNERSNPSVFCLTQR